MKNTPKNSLYYGDNLEVLRRYVQDESVDLIYLDPPFNSNQDYNVLFAEQDRKPHVEPAAHLWKLVEERAIVALLQWACPPSRPRGFLRSSDFDSSILDTPRVICCRSPETRRNGNLFRPVAFVCSVCLFGRDKGTAQIRGYGRCGYY